MDDLTTCAFFALNHHQMLKSGDTVIAACSGGADSVALFHFLFTHAKQLGITLRAVHVNHGMRGAQSDADAAFVAHLCAKSGVPLDTITLTPPIHAGEAWARQERYAFFDTIAKRYGAAVATAHTKNDNAETVLLHLARGAGVHGAAGIPAVRCGLSEEDAKSTLATRYLRPLLYVTRAQVEDYNLQHGMTWVTDATNDTDDYARNRARHILLPALESLHAGAGMALARFAEEMTETAHYLDAQAGILLEHARISSKMDAVLAVVPDEPVAYSAAAMAAAPLPVRRAALRLLISTQADPSHATLLAAEQAVLQRTGAVQLSARCRLCVTQGVLRVQTARTALKNEAYENNACKRQAESHVYEKAGVLLLSDAIASTQSGAGTHIVRLSQGIMLTIWIQSYEEFIKFEKMPSNPLKFWADYDRISVNAGFRTRRAGDMFAPAGRGVTKSLKKLFSEAKLSGAARAALPVLVQGSTVLWAAGFGFAQGVLPDADTRTLLQIQILDANGGINHDA